MKVTVFEYRIRVADPCTVRPEPDPGQLKKFSELPSTAVPDPQLNFFLLSNVWIPQEVANTCPMLSRNIQTYDVQPSPCSVFFFIHNTILFCRTALDWMLCPPEPSNAEPDQTFFTYGTVSYYCTTVMQFFHNNGQSLRWVHQTFIKNLKSKAEALPQYVRYGTYPNNFSIFLSWSKCRAGSRLS